MTAQMANICVPYLWNNEPKSMLQETINPLITDWHTGNQRVSREDDEVSRWQQQILYTAFGRSEGYRSHYAQVQSKYIEASKKMNESKYSGDFS